MPNPIKYEFIYFEEKERKPKTVVWECRNLNNNALLGVVKWFAPWRGYAYFPATAAVYSAGCLTDISTFIGFRMEQHRAR